MTGTVNYSLIFHFLMTFKDNQQMKLNELAFIVHEDSFPTSWGAIHLKAPNIHTNINPLEQVGVRLATLWQHAAPDLLHPFQTLPLGQRFTTPIAAHASFFKKPNDQDQPPL